MCMPIEGVMLCTEIAIHVRLRTTQAALILLFTSASARPVKSIEQRQQRIEYWPLDRPEAP